MEASFIPPTSSILLNSHSVNPEYHWFGAYKRMSNKKEGASLISCDHPNVCVTNLLLGFFSSRLMRPSTMTTRRRVRVFWDRRLMRTTSVPTLPGWEFLAELQRLPEEDQCG